MRLCWLCIYVPSIVPSVLPSTEILGSGCGVIDAEWAVPQSQMLYNIQISTITILLEKDVLIKSKFMIWFFFFHFLTKTNAWTKIILGCTMTRAFPVLHFPNWLMKQRKICWLQANSFNRALSSNKDIILKSFELRFKTLAQSTIYNTFW